MPGGKNARRPRETGASGLWSLFEDPRLFNYGPRRIRPDAHRERVLHLGRFPGPAGCILRLTPWFSVTIATANDRLAMKYCLVSAFFAFSFLCFAQKQQVSPSPSLVDLSRTPTLYVVGYAHLD